MINLGRVTRSDLQFNGTNQRIILDRHHWARYGLVGHWLMNEGGGNIIYDTSDFNNIGNFIGSTNWIHTERDEALEFDDIDNTIIITNKSHFDFERNDSFSFLSWVKTTSSNRDGIYSKIQNSSPFRGINFEKQIDGTIMVEIINSNVINNLRKESIATIDDGKFHFVGFTYDGTSDVSGLKLYIDGKEDVGSILANNLSATISNTISPYIGSFSNNTNFMNGNINDLRIYNRALDKSEAIHLYNNPYPEYSKLLF
jgi:hypothetical protein